MKNILPKGFLASGTHCGIKRFKKDLALLLSEAPCKAVGIFTKNRVKAAPVLVSKTVLNDTKGLRAIVVNSGNANCCTGRYGVRDAKRMISAACHNLNLGLNEVCVASTGVIGRRLPVAEIEVAVPKLAKRLSAKGFLSFAAAILTTDKRVKVEVRKFNIGRKEVTISGAAKGAGMINPNMATMLAFIMTDARIDKDALKTALKDAADTSFNSITIDGDMSTNDSVFLLANGEAENRNIKRGSKEYHVFLKALKEVCFGLAKDIIEDGEGATKFVTVHVDGAKRKRDAYKVARTIANSCLVKTSIHGGDPNWGRIASSVGASGVEGIKQNKIEIWIDGVLMFKDGKFTHPSAKRVSRIYKKRKAEIYVDLKMGKKQAKVYTCDLSKRYVEINSHYMT